jgi:hypothetical protein
VLARPHKQWRVYQQQNAKVEDAQMKQHLRQETPAD